MSMYLYMEVHVGVGPCAILGGLQAGYSEETEREVLRSGIFYYNFR